MPLFHFHLRSREGVERDGSGVEFADAESAYLDAFETARTMWGEMLGRREDPTAYTFEITDEEDHLVLELPFSEVLDATRRNRRAPKPAAAGAARKCAARTLALVTALREQIELSRIAVKQAGSSWTERRTASMLLANREVAPDDVMVREIRRGSSGRDPHRSTKAAQQRASVD